MSADPPPEPAQAEPKQIRLAQAGLAQAGLAQTRKARPAAEWAAERVFRPLAQHLVAPAARLGLRPTWIVVAHTGLVLLAASQIRQGKRLSPALLLQVKTVLDNLDGQLARATDQTTLTGRYLDSELDVLGNLALLVALHGPLVGTAANLLLSLILSTDYLWEKDYRAARGEVFRTPAAQQGDNLRLLAVLERAYALYFGPQEKLLGGLFESRLKRVAGQTPTQAQRETYNAAPPLVLSANLGLSSQLALLGLCLVAGRPRWYGASLLLQTAALTFAQRWREGQVRAGR
jgi:archaetidylinositol phosphate synthase